MSGLLAYVGQKKAIDELTKGLKLMGGYHSDSCGMLLKAREKYFVKKVIGGASDLEREAQNYDGAERTGAVHLRWATYGAVEEKNVHPIFSCDGKVAVMHKGIIANYRKLKTILERDGHVFRTQTDTEVVAHLVEKYYVGDLQAAVRRSLLDIDGVYALVVFYMDQKDEMVVANAGRDMMLGIGREENWVALDKNMLSAFTDKVVYLNDGEMAHVSKDGFVSSIIAGGNINVVSKYIEKLNRSDDGLDEYFSRIEEEIFSQPEMVTDILAGRLVENQSTVLFGGLENYKEFLRTVNRLVFVGSGSSFHAGLLARELLEDYVGLVVSVYSGLRFKNKKYISKDNQTAIFVVSQSGETKDTVDAMLEAKQLGIKVFGITNTVGSKVAKETDTGIFLHSGPTLGMPSARSFMSQLVGLIMLMVYIGRLRGLSPGMGDKIIVELKKLSFNLHKILDQSNNIKELIDKYQDYGNIILVGHRYGFPIAKEAALLFSEIADVSAEAMDLSELEYGLVNKINSKYLVIFLMPYDAMWKKGFDLAKEIHKRGAMLVVLTTEDNARRGEFDNELYVPKSLEVIIPILFLMLLQLWVFYLGKEKNAGEVNY
ncbi:SIS domain-containing protein [Patescibacteria group bacterium]|nr:SIS domain-containing protein [Patescibacteria group bacterium]